MNTITALLIAVCVLSSMAHAAEVYSAEEDYVWQERFAERLKLARVGNAEAQFNIGEMYEKGSGVAANLRNAFTWFELAAKQNHQKAQYKIASMYYRGEGVEGNPAKAFHLMERLAKNGYARAQYYLALMHETGVVTKRDLGQAHLWYSRAAAGGYTPAAEVLEDKVRFPAQRAPSEIATAKSAPARPKNIPHTKAPVDTLPVPNIVGENPDPPIATDDTLAATLRNEAARGSQVGLRDASDAHLDLPAPPVTSVASLKPVVQTQPTIYATLANGNWMSQANLPVEFLPSELTSCASNDAQAIECVSMELVRTIGKSEIGYQTQATVYAVQPSGEFKVTYRNNIVKINREPGSKTTTESAGVDKEIKLGLQETEHFLECKLEDESTIQCVKNRTQKITITNHREL